MHTIPELLDMAKVRTGLKSDRQLAVALGLSHLHPYRTKGVIPNDETAYKLAELCGLPPEEVMLTCHLWRIQGGGDVAEAWGRVFKKVVGAAIVLTASLTASPTPSNAAIHLLTAPPNYTLCDVVFWGKAMLVLDNVKDAEIRFRIPAWLKADFLRHCQRRDVPAAHLLRRFVRAVVVEQAVSFEDEVQVIKSSPDDCPRCGGSEIKNLTSGYGLCLGCRLVWRTMPEGSEMYSDRVTKKSSGGPQN